MLQHEGKFIDTLAVGRHVRWGKNYRVTVLDTRKTLLTVPGQATQGVDNYIFHLYNAVRLIEDQPALATLRFLQTLEGNAANQMLVMNDLPGFAPTFAASASKRSKSV